MALHIETVFEVIMHEGIVIFNHLHSLQSLFLNSK